MTMAVQYNIIYNKIFKIMLNETLRSTRYKFLIINLYIGELYALNYYYIY